MIIRNQHRDSTWPKQTWSNWKTRFLHCGQGQYIYIHIISCVLFSPSWTHLCSRADLRLGHRTRARSSALQGRTSDYWKWWFSPWTMGWHIAGATLTVEYRENLDHATFTVVIPDSATLTVDVSRLPLSQWYIIMKNTLSTYFLATHK